jgi:hypothetical protein
MRLPRRDELAAAHLRSGAIALNECVQHTYPGTHWTRPPRPQGWAVREDGRAAAAAALGADPLRGFRGGGAWSSLCSQGPQGGGGGACMSDASPRRARSTAPARRASDAASWTAGARCASASAPACGQRRPRFSDGFRAPASGPRARGAAGHRPALRWSRRVPNRRTARGMAPPPTRPRRAPRLRSKEDAFNSKEDAFNSKEDAFHSKEDAFNSKEDAFHLEPFPPKEDAFNGSALGPERLQQRSSPRA